MLNRFVFSLVICATLCFGQETTKSLPKLILDRVKTLKEYNFSTETRIIGGFDVQGIDNTPYLVSISVSRIAYAHICAGVIFHKEWVLTTAHCIEELKNINGNILGTAIYAGIKNRENVTNAQVRLVDFSSSHRQFTGVAGSDNIALLHASVPFIFSDRVQQISLPAFNEDFTDKLVTSYGWGLVNPDDTGYSKELQYAFAPVHNASVCAGALPNEAPMNNRQICTFVKACYGDGGTPLVFWPLQGTPELVGLTSWAYVPCNYGNRPTVYTEVSKYIDWIYQVLSAYYLLGKV